MAVRPDQQRAIAPQAVRLTQAAAAQAAQGTRPELPEHAPEEPKPGMRRQPTAPRKSLTRLLQRARIFDVSAELVGPQREVRVAGDHVDRLNPGAPILAGNQREPIEQV